MSGWEVAALLVWWAVILGGWVITLRWWIRFRSFRTPDVCATCKGTGETYERLHECICERGQPPNPDCPFDAMCRDCDGLGETLRPITWPERHLMTERKD